MLAELDNAINQVLNLSRYNRSPDEKTVAINAASAELFKFICGPVGEYSAGRPVSRVNNQETSTTYSLLSSFYRAKEVLAQTNEVDAGVPAWDVATEFGPRLYDVELLLARYGSEIGVAVKILPDNQVRQRIKSKLVPPSPDVPIGEYYEGNRYAVYPLPKQVFAKVLLFPIQAKIVYNAQGVYDPTQSIDLDWPDSALNSLLVRSIKYLGINIPNATIFQAAGLLQQQLV
jgi:hypothetical protein